MDEILALQSIFPQTQPLSLTSPLPGPDWDDDALDAHTGLSAYTLPVALALPNADDADAEPYLLHVSWGPDQTATFPLSHLPPIMLHVQPVEGYPSSAPPELDIQASWLSPARKDIILAALEEEVLEESDGDVCVFEIATFLADSVLEALDATSELCISPDSIPPESQVEDVVEVLLHFDADERAAVFSAEMHECPVCYTDVLGSRSIVLDCGHFACHECMTTLVEVSIRDKTLEALVCPSWECGAPIPHTLVAELVDSETYEKFDQFALDAALSQMDDIAYCPREKCGAPTVVHAETQQGTCPKCCYAFCGLCAMPSHANECLTPEARLAVLERRASSQGASSSSSSSSSHVNLARDLQSLRYIASTSRLCPCCGQAITKIAGCNKMTCTTCYAGGITDQGKLKPTLFCYVCGVQIKGYDHFSSATSSIGCPLFDTDANTRAAAHNAARMAPRGVAREEQVNERNMRRMLLAADVRPSKPVKCPRCGARNRKWSPENSIQCYNCLTRFCFLCYEPIGKRATGRKQHFGPLGPHGCAQHTPL